MSSRVAGFPATEICVRTWLVAQRSSPPPPRRASRWSAIASSIVSGTGGDFAMTAAEVQPVLRALRKADLHIVALHNHMIGEEPAYFFVHFWGKGPAADLARGFRSALDAQAAATE